MRNFLFALAVLLGISALPALAQDSQDSSAAQPSSPSRAVPAELAASRVRLLQLIPAALPAQAKANAPAEFYSAANLYQYMDGGADIYALYNLQLMLHQEFKADTADVTVDIFDMGTAENAFGMYASERSPAYDYIALGAEGYRNQGIVNFLQGPFYFKLAAFGEGADAALDRFACALSAQAGPEKSFPALLQKFPTAARLPHSEQYVLQDPLGHSFLGPAYLASYGTEEKSATLLVSVAADEAGATERLARLAEHFKKSGQCAEAPELGPHAFRASNSFEGQAVASSTGRYTVVLFHPENAPVALFAEALRNLR
ncbi:MAG: hypothetical protein P4M01_05375 [Acidobacteriota bacterium]|nr:hypothetical protein [Acidobacteriota bacterium]